MEEAQQFVSGFQNLSRRPGVGRKSDSSDALSPSAEPLSKPTP
jgi:hypothetical protein